MGGEGKICIALGGRSRHHELEFDRPERLPANCRSIIEGWFRRAISKLHAPESECFEPFIFTWIAFNAWAEAVTGLERETGDKGWVETLSRDEFLFGKFANRIQNADDDVTRAAQQFRRYWPIPKMQDLRSKEGPSGWLEIDPHEERLRFFEKYSICYEPRCAPQHVASSIPLDWEHFIRATYRVRCNLFHGDKSLYHPDDQIIVASAFRALAGFLDGQRIFPR